MKRIVYLLIFSSFLFSQNKRYFDFDEIDGPKVFSKPSSIAHPSFLPALNKLKDPSVTGGKISNVTQHWTLLDNVNADELPIVRPASLVFDSNGNMYFTSRDIHVIRKVDTNGKISTFAGNGFAGGSGDGGSALEASLNDPVGLAIDSNDNIYVADRNNHRVRKIDTNGIITKFAGGDGEGDEGDGGAAVEAKLSGPYGLIFDSSGSLLISGNRKIRKVDTNGIISTFAGNGDRDYAGDGGAATSAALNFPSHMTFDRYGNLYFADPNHHVVRKVDTNGNITKLYGIDGETAGNSDSNPKGLQDALGVSYERIKVDAQGEDEDVLYITDTGNHAIIQVVLRGKNAGEPQSGEAYVEAEVLWGEEGTADFDGDGDANWDETARFSYPEIMTTNFTASSTELKAIYHVVDYGNNRIRKISESENFTNNTETNSMQTVVGADIYNGSNIVASSARLSVPRNSAFDKNGNYFVADQLNHIIRKIDTNGIMTTVAGTPGEIGDTGNNGAATSAKLESPRGVTVDSQGNLYISDTENHRIRKVDTDGIITTFAGVVNFGYSGDGNAATSAQLNFPYQITVDASDNVYFADNRNNVIRKVDISSGTISTVAGNGNNSFSGDDGLAVNASLSGPLGVIFDSKGNMYIADSANNRIRKVDTNGKITTFAGTGDSDFYDNASGNEAKFSYPSTLAVDSKDNIYVTDSGNHAVRKITPDGFVTSVVGNYGRGYRKSDSTAFSAALAQPYGISIDANDNIYLSDSWNYVVRKFRSRKTTLKVPSEYASIQAAIDYAVSGDTILIDSGTYKEALVMNNKTGLVLHGVDPKTTIIDGLNANRPILISSGKDITVKNFTIQNGVCDPNDPHGGGAIKIDDSQNTTLQNLILRDNYSWANGSAIGISGKVDWEAIDIINVLAYKNIGSNTLAVLGVKTNIINSTFMNNDSNNEIQIYDGGDVDEARVRVLNSIIGGGIEKGYDSNRPNDSYFIASGSYLARRDTLRYKDQDIVGASNEHFEMIPGGPGEWVLEPVFVDSANGDYRLADYSPGIGYGRLSHQLGKYDGTVLTAPTEDLVGNVRSSSVKPDIGAYENQYDTPQNAPPVLSAIQDVSVNEDESVSVLVNAINAFNLDNDPIVFSASSEKDEVKINVGSSSGKLDISASSNWNGSSKINVSATDGKAFDYGNFTVKFLPVNDKPELEPISDFSIDEEAVTSLTVKASDVDGDELTVSATTSTNQVVPSVDGMELTLTPAKDFVGTASVNVFVTDGSLADTVSYQLTVLNVNDAPVLFEIKDQVVSEDSKMNVRVVASDVDDNVLIYDGKSDNVGVGVSASADTIKLQPVTDFFGSSVITVYASDGKDVDSTTFTLKVNPMQDSPFPFEWVSSESDSVVVTKDNLSDTYDLEWSESKDVDDEGIDYLVYAKIGVYEKELIYDTTSTKLAISYQEIVENVFNGAPNHGATVVFSVSATDRIDTLDVSGSDRVMYVNQYQYLSIENEGIPDAFVLHDNYPNPFNPTTQIRFDLPTNDNVNLTIYNMLGQKVKVFSINNISAGYHQITWDATNDIGDPVSAGVYLYQLQTSEFVKTKKMILLK